MRRPPARTGAHTGSRIRAAIGSLLLLAACSANGTIDGPVLSEPDRRDREHMAAIIRGTLAYDAAANCLRLTDSAGAVVFPPGSSWQADPPAVRLRSGQVLPMGVPFTAGGGSVPLAMLESLAGSQMATAARRCAGADGSAVMLQSAFTIPA